MRLVVCNLGDAIECIIQTMISDLRFEQETNTVTGPLAQNHGFLRELPELMYW